MDREHAGAEQMALFDCAKAERFARDADRWIEANPDAWAYMTRAARISAQSNRRFGIGALCEYVRWQMLVEGVSEFKLNNNHRAAFARRLIREVPECEPYIATRHSCLDL